MAARRGLGDYQSAGFGGLSFATDMNFMNLPMRYEQRLWALEGLYACALAKIEGDANYCQDKEIGLLIGATRLLLDQAGADYKSHFESTTTFGELENNYRRLLSQIFEKITEIQGKTKMIERVVEEQKDAG